MQDNDSLAVPFFKAMAIENAVASKANGRPMFDDVDVVEIRLAGDRNYSPTFPAHAMWRRVDGEEITYAERFKDAYARFKDGREQVAIGTPLSELPFLTEARRMELRALKVYTAEALASIEGGPLKNLGPNGRDMKEQAAAYLERAGGTARDIALVAEVEALKAQLASLTAGGDAQAVDEKAELKDRIEAATGQRPRGNPSVETLREMVAELA